MLRISKEITIIVITILLLLLIIIIIDLAVSYNFHIVKKEQLTKY